MNAKLNYRNLQEFIQALDEAGELKRVTTEVDPHLEVTEIADRVMKQPKGGAALLFENVKGSEFPLGINLFGSDRRMGMALGVESLDEIGDRLSEMLKLEVPDSLMGKLAMLPMLKEMASFPPRGVRSGACQEVVLQGDDIDLSALPVITCWPDDGGPYITLPLVITKDPGEWNPERRDVPDAGAGSEYDGDALAAPQGGRASFRAGQAKRGEDGGCCRSRGRSGYDVQRHCAAPAGHR